MSVESLGVEVKLKEYDESLHICMKCECCNFVLTSEIENVEIRDYIMRKINSMSIIFEDEKKG